ncbi:hypothetical protein IE53DRAFT_17702 [Violaceomyces palustris]|uniref:Uncharacterized protein n=1 Tax=Violaceomyces palustris TaxID=1673888 RepID=A0ACD0NLF3_9BASI|nr:hypothetical protein IE53DRAFT_17702 [Violaceomyces palustris]
MKKKEKKRRPTPPQQEERLHQPAISSGSMSASKPSGNSATQWESVREGSEYWGIGGGGQASRDKSETPGHISTSARPGRGGEKRFKKTRK